MLQHHPSQLALNTLALTKNSAGHTRYPITPTSVPGHEGAGMGRIIRLAQPVPLLDIIDRIGRGMGSPRGFPIAIPQGTQASDVSVRSIALCAGSGGGLFAQAEKNGEEVDLYFTGELSHHEALAAVEKGKCVVVLFHSNTERGFLHSVLKGQLDGVVREEVSLFFLSPPLHALLWLVVCLNFHSGGHLLLLLLACLLFFPNCADFAPPNAQWEKIRTEERGREDLSDDYLEVLNDDSSEIHVSEMDRDPYGIMISKDEL
jgi:hypothetical protein